MYTVGMGNISVCVCVRAYVCVCVHACVRACVCVGGGCVCVHMCTELSLIFHLLFDRNVLSFLV